MYVPLGKNAPPQYKKPSRKSERKLKDIPTEKLVAITQSLNKEFEDEIQSFSITLGNHITSHMYNCIFSLVTR